MEAAAADARLVGLPRLSRRVASIPGLSFRTLVSFFRRRKKQNVVVIVYVNWPWAGS